MSSWNTNIFTAVYPSTDFSSLTADIPEVGILQNEIFQSSITAVIQYITCDDGYCNILFDIEPSSGDKTTIENVVNVHTGVVVVEPPEIGEIGVSEISSGDDGYFLITNNGTSQWGMPAVFNLMNGTIIETTNVVVSSNGTTISINVEKEGGGDLSCVFDTQVKTFTSTSISLTAGTDTSPTRNYVYIVLNSGVPTLSLSTSGFPEVEHCPVADVLCQSASSLQTDGAYKVHVWTDHVYDTNNQGHLSHLNARFRAYPTTWIDGTSPTTIITNSSPDQIDLSTTSGCVYQLHLHDFPARDTAAGDPVFIVNHNTTPYLKTSDLETILDDSLGNSLTGSYYSLVIWGVVSEDAVDCKLMCNLPSGSYSSENTLIADADKYTNFTIPQEYVGTGFLIAQIQLRHANSGGGTSTLINTIDLRGMYPTSYAGGNVALNPEFITSNFKLLDGTDSSKELSFDISNITTSTNRVITVPDSDITLDNNTDPRPPNGSAGGDLIGSYPNPTIDSGAITFSKLQDISSDRLIGRDSSGSGDAAEISLTSTLVWTGSNSIGRAEITGDISIPAGSNTAAIEAGVIVNADINASAGIAFSKLATVGTDSLLGRDTAGTGSVEAITLDSTLTMNGSQILGREAITGDITIAAGSNTAAIGSGVIVNADVNSSADIAVSKLAAGTNGQVLTTTGGVAAWGAGGGSSSTYYEVYSAWKLLSPNNSDWAVNGFASWSADSVDPSLIVRRFDDTIDEGVGFGLRIPSGVTDMKLYFTSRALTAPGSTDTVELDLYTKIIGDNIAPGSWSAATSLTDISIPTNNYWQYDSQTLTLSSLSLTAGTYVQFELVKSGGTLSGDWVLLEVIVEFS